MNDDYLRIFNHVKQRLEKDRKNLEVGLQLSESEILSTIEKTEDYWDIKLSVGEKEKMLVDLDALLRISVLPINKIVNKGWKPWLHLRSEEQKGVFYSDRYRQYLLNKAHLPERIINEIFDTSDKILDCLANPLSDDSFKKKGLVIGHVQSGKTANYIGLINRASDVGYKLIILIAGVHNNLRSQTQNRINEGFIGFDSLKNEPVGVGGDFNTIFLVDLESHPSPDGDIYNHHCVHSNLTLTRLLGCKNESCARNYFPWTPCLLEYSHDARSECQSNKHCRLRTCASACYCRNNGYGHDVAEKI
jgi:hypothetical protein